MSNGSSGRPVKISARQLTVTFGLGSSGVKALGPIDLDVGDGEFLCLLGPSGCGKSTFIRVVAGLQAPTSGTVDLSLRGGSLAPSACVFQDFGIFPWKTVVGNVEFALRVRNVPKKQARERALDWLSRLGLADFADAYPHTLSGGMRQRVGIARALAVEPEILLMDEPFAALDAQRRELLQEELLEICEADARTVIFVTHSIEEALILADRVVVMTARPGRTMDVAEVPFGRPRDPSIRSGRDFSELRAQLWEHLKTEVGSRPLPSQVKKDVSHV